MVVGELSSRTDVAVIGAGPGGYVAALELARAGKQVTLVEKARVGGTCLNVGCIPSKTLLHVADLAALAGTTDETGVTIAATVDPARIRSHLAAVVERLTTGVRTLLDVAGVETVTGTAHFARPDRLAIETATGVTHLEFGHAVVATGSRPVELPGLPFGVGSVVDSTVALALEEIPARMVIVGAGYIGVELGTAFAKLGSRVILVEAMDRILPGLATSLTRPVAARLDALGVEVSTGTLAEGLDDDGTSLRTRRQGETRCLRADQVVVAVGRRPNSDGLGLERCGVTVGPDGLVEVDVARRAAPRIYAIGDLTEGPALAHKATAEAHVAAEAILGRPAGFDPAAIPAVVYSDPEIATVGHTVGSAAAAGVPATSFRFPNTASARAVTLGRSDGHAELVADDAGTIIGAHLVGSGAAELIAEAALAIEMAATVEDLAATIHPHPTASEAMAEAALGLAGHPLHVSRRS